jgi:glucokinase
MSGGGGYSMGVDIGVTNVKVVGVAPGGEVLFRETFETRGESANWPVRVREGLAEIEGRRGWAATIGVAAPGVARADGTCIRWMRGRLAEVQRLNWGEFLGRGCVPVLNDAQAALLGEAWIGAARGGRNVMLLTLGTGVGGAAMVDGRLLRGHLGRAGHLGHICLDMEGERDIVNMPGSLESLVGNYSVTSRSGGRFETTHALVHAFRQGDPEAVAMWESSLDALACGIASLANVLDPEVVIIGGGIAMASDALFGPLESRLRDVEWSLEGEHVKVVPAALGEFAGAIGAAWNAMSQQTGEFEAK